VFGQQTVAITAFIFLSGAMALGKIGEMGHEKIRVDTRVIGALFLAATVFYIRDAASSPYRRPWDWGGQDAADFARIRATDQVKPTDSVRASRTLLTLLAERERLYDLTLGDAPDAARAADGVDVIVLDDRQVPQWSSVDRQVFRLGLQSLGFRQVSNEEGIELFVRIPATSG